MEFHTKVGVLQHPHPSGARSRAQEQSQKPPRKLSFAEELDDLRSPLRGIASLVIALRFRGGKILKSH